MNVLGCDRTHGAGPLGNLDKFMGVNLALSVDLFGQCNLEVAAGSMVSGVGGAPDFARAARQSKGGISLIALPSSYGGGAKSRIVPRLGNELVSLPRTDVDVVCTENGAADLRGLSVHERAAALIEIASTHHRAARGSVARDRQPDLNKGKLGETECAGATRSSSAAPSRARSTRPRCRRIFPITPAQIADDAVAAAEAGAAILHLHARDPKPGVPRRTRRSMRNSCLASESAATRSSTSPPEPGSG